MLLVLLVAIGCLQHASAQVNAIGLLPGPVAQPGTPPAKQPQQQQPRVPPTSKAAAGAPTSTTTSTTSSTPRFPFPQCISTTTNFDTLFVGQLRYAQVGSVRYAYHRFGPWVKAAAGQARVSNEAGARSGGSTAAAAEAARERNPLLLIAGTGMSMYMWPVPMLTTLAETREVIIFDNMGTGLTTDSRPQPLSIPAMAASSAGLIAALRLRKPDVWAWSLGGSVAYALLASQPDVIGSAIIASASPGGPASFVPPPAATDALVAAGAGMSALLPLLFPQGVKDDGVCGFFAAYSSFSASEFTALKAPLDIKALQAQLAALEDWAREPAATNARLSAASNRVLILQGVQDRLVPVRNAPAAAGLLLGSWMMQFPDAGHALPFDNTQAMIFMTEEFLRFSEPMAPSAHEWLKYGQPAASAGGSAGASRDSWMKYGSSAVAGAGVAQPAAGALQPTQPRPAAGALQPPQPRPAAASTSSSSSMSVAGAEEVDDDTAAPRMPAMMMPVRAAGAAPGMQAAGPVRRQPLPASMDASAAAAGAGMPPAQREVMWPVATAAAAGGQVLAAPAAAVPAAGGQQQMPQLVAAAPARNDADDNDGPDNDQADD